MKDKAKVFIGGIVLGALIASGSFCAYTFILDKKAPGFKGGPPPGFSKDGGFPSGMPGGPGEEKKDDASKDANADAKNTPTNNANKNNANANKNNANANANANANNANAKNNTNQKTTQ